MKIEYFNLVDRKLNVVEENLEDALAKLSTNMYTGQDLISNVWFYESDICPRDLNSRDEMELPFNLIKFIAEITRTQHMSVRFPNGCGFTKIHGDRKLSIFMSVES
jgi:hypothetical protein